MLTITLQPEMIGHYLGEFSITYKPVKHGRPGIGATHSSRFIPLKYPSLLLLSSPSSLASLCFSTFLSMSFWLQC